MRRVICAIWLGGMFAAAQAHATQPIPIEALARQPALQSLTMTADGKYLVGLIPSPVNPEQTALATWDTATLGKGPVVVTPSGTEGHMQFVRALALPDDKVLVSARQEWTGQLGQCGEGKAVGATRTFVHKAYLTGVGQRRFRVAFASAVRRTGISRQTRTCLELTGRARFVTALAPGTDQVIIERVDGLRLVGSYYLYDLKTGHTRLLFRGSPRTSPVLFDRHTGRLLVKSRVRPTGGDFEVQILIRDPATGHFKVQPALTTTGSKRYVVKVVGRDDASGNYYVLTDQFSDKVQARVYDPVAQQYAPRPLVANPNYNITRLLFGRQPVNFNKVVGFVVGGPYPREIYVAPALKAIHTGLKQVFRGRQIHIAAYSNNFSKVLFTTIGTGVPESWHLLLDRKRVVNLGSKRPWIKPGLAGTERWISYAVRDGMMIPAILDLPAGWTQGDPPAPAVILPHGGPWARDWMGWRRDAWVPMLTSRGYAVLRPQYRGSRGLGRRLWLAGDGQWGRKMSDDLDDGAAWLVAQGIADKNRIAIFGYSYGGFAAVAADVRSPSPYRCAIAGAPLADLGRLGTAWSDYRLQRIYQGRTVKGMDPMRNTAKAHLPILIFDGDRDVRTPRPIHAIPFYDAVKDKVPARLVLIPDMPHGLPWYPRQKRRIDHLILAFLAGDNCHMATPENPASGR